MIHRTLEVQVAAMSEVADGIKSIELGFTSSHDRSALSAGAHIDIHLPTGVIRSYSLIGWCDRSYRIAVARDRLSRGGSQWMHEKLAVGDKLVISEPRNNFPLNEQALNTVLIAGGIGITPIYAMARRLDELGKPWRLYYFARSKSTMAFVPELQGMNGRVVLHADDAHGGPSDLAPLIQSSPPLADLYCCGPLPMLQRFEELTQNLDRDRIHVEYFAPVRPPDTGGGVTITLARSKKVILVPAGKTILNAVLDEGVDPLCSCLEGHCGTCETLVLDGVPDHRDVFLTTEQKAKNDRMMICVSGALTRNLTLDL
jgi:vanillate O-demethylase ferredoxin subunit